MTLQEQIRANRVRTFVVLLGFAALGAVFVGIIFRFYQPGVAGLVGVVAIGYGLFSWFFADKMVAAAAGAHPIAKADAPRLYHAIEVAAIGAGLTKTPDVYIVDDPAPNAFAAGRDPDHAYIAATTGLLEKLDDRELEGVMAHEVAHVRNRDVRLMSLAAVLVGVIVLAADMLMRVTIWGGGGARRRDDGMGVIGLVVGILAAILAPIAAALLQMALSRRREYLADASAVEITGDPEGLARALAALRDDTNPMRHVTRATAHLYIESPLRDHKGLRSSLGGLFDTHPPLEERIRRLEEAGGFSLGGS